jgi:hypothetical protein
MLTPVIVYIHCQWAVNKHIRKDNCRFQTVDILVRRDIIPRTTASSIGGKRDSPSLYLRRVASDHEEYDPVYTKKNPLAFDFTLECFRRASDILGGGEIAVKLILSDTSGSISRSDFLEGLRHCAKGCRFRRATPESGSYQRTGPWFA